jgi:hypothetical protein
VDMGVEVDDRGVIRLLGRFRLHRYAAPWRVLRQGIMAEPKEEEAHDPYARERPTAARLGLHRVGEYGLRPRHHVYPCGVASTVLERPPASMGQACKGIVECIPVVKAGGKGARLRRLACHCSIEKASVIKRTCCSDPGISEERERKPCAMQGVHHPAGRQQALRTGLAHLYNLVSSQRRAPHTGQCGVEVEGGRVPTRDWMLNLQILTSGGFR